MNTLEKQKTNGKLDRDQFHKAIMELNRTVDFFSEKFNLNLGKPLINFVDFEEEDPAKQEKARIESKSKGQIFMDIKILRKSYETIITQLIHEIVHLYNLRQGIDDINQNVYHNKSFKLTAEMLKMETDNRNPRWGYYKLYLSSEMINLINNELKPKRELFKNIFQYEFEEKQRSPGRTKYYPLSVHRDEYEPKLREIQRKTNKPLIDLIESAIDILHEKYNR